MLKKSFLSLCFILPAASLQAAHALSKLSWEVPKAFPSRHTAGLISSLDGNLAACIACGCTAATRFRQGHLPVSMLN